MVSKVVTYALWLFFGLFGVHHFYLRRYRHGLVWLCTIGGFGYGWLRDFFQLNVYIKEAKEDEEEAAEEEEQEEEEEEADAKNGTISKRDDKEDDEGVQQWTKMRFSKAARTTGLELNDDRSDVLGREKAAKKKRRKRLTNESPKCSWTRSTGAVTFAVILDVTFLSAIPEDLLESKETKLGVNLVAAIFAAIGLHTVGNIGRHQLSFMWCLLPSLLGHIVFPAGSDTSIYGIIIAAIVAEWKGKSCRRRRPPPRKRAKAMLIVMVAFFSYLCLWGSGLWFNTYITTSDGAKVRLKDAVENFFNSPAWKEMLDTMLHLYEYVKHHGFGNLYREFIIALDPEGEANAYKVLGLNSDASPQEIKTTCRKLSRQYHPDKARGEEAKEAAGQKFIEVQSACQVLDQLRARRMKNSASSIEL